ncbi:MAG: hypothetical protein E7774_10835 [Bradyrhizobium sp.]|nr:MAG: hypothetical protein E7774_10835 [Bradyrhizobium sp.]
MASVSLQQGWVSGPALSLALGLWLGCAGGPASAGDDGAAPMWVGLGQTFGLGAMVGMKKDDPMIEYRDQPRLVLPPTMELPPPAASPTASATNWPVDPDVVAAKREAAERNKIHRAYLDPGARTDSKFQPTSSVTTDYTAGQGPGQRRCTAGPGQSCDTPRPSPTMDWNPLTWVGIEKKKQKTLGPEPERESLTDPPLGYRAPIEGVGAKVDDN